MYTSDFRNLTGQVYTFSTYADTADGTATAKASSNGPQELPVYHTVGVATIEYPPRRNGGTGTASDPVYTMLDQTPSLYEIPEVRVECQLPRCDECF